MLSDTSFDVTPGAKVKTLFILPTEVADGFVLTVEEISVII